MDFPSEDRSVALERLRRGLETLILEADRLDEVVLAAYLSLGLDCLSTAAHLVDRKTMDISRRD